MKLPKGYSVCATHCGIKKSKPDLGMIYCHPFCTAVGFFTSAVNVSYSLTLSKKNINNPIKAVLVNSGNANCFSHKTGMADTTQIVQHLASLLKTKKSNILIASTGLIGEKLPKEKIISSLPGLVKKAQSCGQKDRIKSFAQSILTTDAFIKTSYLPLKLKEREAGILGFAKGAGMIHPDTATMLAFIITDVKIPFINFKKIAKSAVEESFNSISVDGCTSTNDSVFFLSSGSVSCTTSKDINAFRRGMKKVCLDLAKLIVKDAEGATKFLQLQVKGAKTKSEAKKAAQAIVTSVLFKCALYGQNPNWGRIISALGQAKIKVNESIYIKTSSLKKKTVKMAVDLKRGKQSWTMYTSDLTPEYIRINAEYN